jgi:hypothetical protein
VSLNERITIASVSMKSWYFSEYIRLYNFVCRDSDFLYRFRINEKPQSNHFDCSLDQYLDLRVLMTHSVGKLYGLNQCLDCAYKAHIAFLPWRRRRYVHLRDLFYCHQFRIWYTNKRLFQYLSISIQSGRLIYL